jgi:Ca2+:H+ antiporter
MRALLFTLKDYLDVAMDLSLGYAVTVCLFVGPAFVVLGWCLGQRFALCFGLYGTIVYGISAWVVAYVLADGKSNYMEGALIVGV